MDEQELRRLFTEIGCLMEDTSVIAIMWKRNDTRSISDRATELRRTHNKVDALLDKIEADNR